ncbi:unnamed protein product, partial [Vitis vinifera]
MKTRGDITPVTCTLKMASLSNSVKLKYIKLGYQYLVNHILTFFLIPILMGFLIKILSEFFRGLKTGTKTKDIDILIVNCSIVSPTPSLSAMVINKYKLRMVSTEITTPNYYSGNERSMLMIRLTGVSMNKKTHKGYKGFHSLKT